MEASTQELSNNYKKALTTKFVTKVKKDKKTFRTTNNKSCLAVIDSFKMLNNHPVFDKRLDFLNVDAPIH